MISRTMRVRFSTFWQPYSSSRLFQSGLTVEEIHEKQRLQIEAAVRLQKGGFDAVEVHVAHGYFLDSFVSPL